MLHNLAMSLGKVTQAIGQVRLPFNNSACFMACHFVCEL